MCDAHGFLTKPHWKGWLTTPAQAPLPPPAGPWVDLTWPFSANAPRLPGFDAPVLRRLRSIRDGSHGNVSIVETVTHVGTHLDAPIHFVEDAPAFQDIPASRLTGHGVVWRIETTEYGVIGAGQLAQARPLLQPGDFLVIDAGWTQRFGDQSYFRHPSLSLEAAEWLVSQKIALLGVDWPNPDAPEEKRGDNYRWPVHRTLLANGVLIAEHLTNVRELAGQRVEFIFGAINIVDGDGSPARVLARRLTGN